MAGTTVALHERLLGKSAEQQVRKIGLTTAIIGFVIHLALWFAYQIGILEVGSASTDLLDSPLDALYTPFSILLAYEVYQLIRAIPESFSTAVGKQFEIVTLLVVRDIFKRLSELEFSGDWTIDSELKLIVLECLTFITLFTTSLIYRANSNTDTKVDFKDNELLNFVQNKQKIAVVLLATYLIVAIFSFTNWVISVSEGDGSVTREIFFLKVMQHPNVIKLYEIIESPKKLYLIMEYAGGSELFDYIVERGCLEEDEACSFFQ